MGPKGVKDTFFVNFSLGLSWGTQCPTGKRNLSLLVVQWSHLLCPPFGPLLIPMLPTGPPSHTMCIRAGSCSHFVWKLFQRASRPPTPNSKCLHSLQAYSSTPLQVEVITAVHAGFQAKQVTRHGPSSQAQHPQACHTQARQAAKLLQCVQDTCPPWTYILL